MLGFADPWIAAAFLSCLLSAGLCVVWGLWRWNAEEPPMPDRVHPPGEPDVDEEI